MSTDTAPGSEILDVQGCLGRFDGDKQLFLEITSMLLEDAPRLFADLEAAVAIEDAPEIAARAHALKGILSNCGGIRAARVAEDLEDAGRHEVLGSTSKLLKSLELELSQLIDAIGAYRSSSR